MISDFGSEDLSISVGRPHLKEKVNAQTGLWHFGSRAFYTNGGYSSGLELTWRLKGNQNARQ
jgi:hypothetical protein